MDGLTTAEVLEPVEPGYKNVLRVRMLAFWLPAAVAADHCDGRQLSAAIRRERGSYPVD